MEGILNSQLQAAGEIWEISLDERNNVWLEGEPQRIILS